MRIVSFILSLWLAASTWAAITDRYVTDAGAGSGNGSSIANAMSYATFTDYMVTGGSFTAAPGDRFNIIGAITGRTTTADTWVNGGNATSPVIVRGWKSDNTTVYAGRTGGNGPLITTDFPTITYTTGRINVTGTFIEIENLDVRSTGGTGSTVQIGANSIITRCYVQNSATAGGSIAVNLSTAVNAAALDCDVFQTASSGGATALFLAGTSSRAIGNRVRSTSGSGIVCRSSALVLNNTVFNCGTVGIFMDQTTGAPQIIGNTIYGCTGDGIDIITGTTGLQFIVGNMITDNGGYGVDFNSASVAGYVAYNRTRDNTSGAYNLATDWVAASSQGDVTTDTGGASTDYVDAGGLDFSLIRTSPATSAGLPAYSSIGALQRDQTAASGGQKAFAY